MEYGDVLYNIGLIDANQKLVFQQQSKEGRDAIGNKAGRFPINNAGTMGVQYTVLPGRH